MLVNSWFQEVREGDKVGRRKEMGEKGGGKKRQGVNRGGEKGETRYILKRHRHRDLLPLPRVNSISEVNFLIYLLHLSNPPSKTKTFVRGDISYPKISKHQYCKKYLVLGEQYCDCLRVWYPAQRDTSCPIVHILLLNINQSK